jgi:hypothetical protein
MTVIGTICGSVLAMLALLGLVARAFGRAFKIGHRFVAAVTENTAALSRLESMLSGHVKQTEHRLTSAETRLDALNGRVDNLERQAA